MRVLLAGIFLLGPVIAGLAGSFLPAFNWFPVLGRHDPGIGVFAELFAVPGFGRSLWLSLFTGFLATLISAIVGFIIPGILYQHRGFSWLRRMMAPILSLPHITVAVGMMFLLQPSGWLVRLISPGLTGWDRPPNLAIVPDEHGLMLVLGLIAKEVPFLVLMMLAAMGQIDIPRLLSVARSLGYTRMKAWFTIIIPQLWPRMRMAVMIVLVFSLSVVDMAAVLAPSTPPPLALRTLEWYRDPDLQQRFIASAAAVFQLVLAVLSIGLLILGEKVASRFCRGFLISGRRGHVPLMTARILRGVMLLAGIIPLVLAALGMAAALIWSVAAVWRFPDATPQALTLRYWAGLSGGLGQIALNTAVLGAASALLSLIAVIVWLESQPRHKSRHNPRTEQFVEKMFFLPLLIPQIGFLFGLQVMLLWLGLDGHVMAVIWVHCLYVFPYIWLALAPSWRRWDPRWGMVGAALGQGPVRRFFRIKLPMLLTPTLTSFAIGFSVSAALYLPTVFAGNARLQTLTVESVILASAAGRQPLGVATGLQMLLPLIVFVVAASISRWRFNRLSGLS